MPLKKTGKKVLASMSKEYWAKKGKQVFYASINKGTLPKAKMEGKKSLSPKKKK